jgi:prepilin-type N-terminal cleavage/methylation domain-containing protein
MISLRLKAFTLIEVAIVITIIGLLLAAILNNVRPGLVINNTINTARWRVASGIESAMIQYTTQTAPLGVLPVDKPVPTGISNAVDICARDAADTSDCIELADYLEGSVIKELPSIDNLSDNRSGYSIYLGINGVPNVIPHLTNSWTFYKNVPTATCADLIATIYVRDGKIIGGSQDGTDFTGTLIGTNGNDVIVGTDGNDIINGGNGNDIICGGNGNDIIDDGGNGKDVMLGGAGNDILDGGNGNDILCGGSGDDTLDGGKGTDELDGYTDNAVFGSSGDVLNGGNGNNDNCYNGETEEACELNTEVVFCMPFQESDSVPLYCNETANCTDFSHCADELINPQGSYLCDPSVTNSDCQCDGARTCSAAGFCEGLSRPDAYPEVTSSSSSSSSISLSSSSSSISSISTAPTCNGLVATIYVDSITNSIIGGPNNGATYVGTLNGGNGPDVIVGTSGDDIIDGGDKADTICGGEGNDIMTGGGGNDVDTMFGGSGNDTISGDNGADVLNGDDGDDEINGGNGKDIINGGAGTDTANGGNSKDTCISIEVPTSC